MPARGRHPHHRLTDLAVRRARPGRHADGHGLYLFVRPNGARSWVQRLVIGDRRRDLGLGGYPLVALAEARVAALENRKLARSGADPTAVQAHRTAPVVSEVVEAVIKARRANWRTSGTERKWRHEFETLVFPRIGEKAVNLVSLEDLREIVEPHWKGRGSTGYVLRQHLDCVMQWAVAHKYRQDNPAADIRILLRKVKAVVRHHPSLPYRTAPAAMAAVGASEADPVVKFVLLFLVLCASRFSEAAGVRWSEVDAAARVWTLPADRMKSRRRHQVPLSVQALELLERARTLGRPGALVFPVCTRRGIAGPVARAAVSRLLRSLDLFDDEARRVVPHGFRSTFRVWAMEEAQAPFEVCEAALAHVQSDQTVAAYARSDLFKLRRRLMQRWADYVTPRRAR